MDVIVALLSSSILFLAALFVLVVGLLRLLGRRIGRLDRAAEVTAAAAAMTVYPASLRGVAPVVPPPFVEEDDDR